mmetsp:Transcript_19654/g.46134  ORF Transcript_19654/g.46134 Transcript_19654/m.46134 type:complete len:109 (-) Transcript_19654:1568-1894(-)
MQGLTLTAGRLEKNPPTKAKEQGFQLAESYESSFRRARKGIKPRIVDNDMKIGRMWRPALVAIVPNTPPMIPPTAEPIPNTATTKVASCTVSPLFELNTSLKKTNIAP